VQVSDEEKERIIETVGVPERHTNARSLSERKSFEIFSLAFKCALDYGDSSLLFSSLLFFCITSISLLTSNCYNLQFSLSNNERYISMISLSLAFA